MALVQMATMSSIQGRQTAHSLSAAFMTASWQALQYAVSVLSQGSEHMARLPHLLCRVNRADSWGCTDQCS